VVRALHLDIAQWAMEDPARWAPWAVPCPISSQDVARYKDRRHRKSRMDQRTRERLPVLPTLAARVAAERTAAVARLAAASATAPGQEFTVGGQTLRRVQTSATTARTWAQDPSLDAALDPAQAPRRDLTTEENRAFWTWAAVEVLRHTGIRIEELTELSHHSLIH
jgi:hypothetical protein